MWLGVAGCSPDAAGVPTTTAAGASSAQSTGSGAASPTQTVATGAAATEGVITEDDALAYSLLDFYLNGGRSEQSIFYEVQALTSECMKAVGWDYPVKALTSDAPLTFNELRQFRLAHGYGLADGLDTPDIAQINDQYDLSFQAERQLTGAEADSFYRALLGDTTGADQEALPGSCLGDAEAAVYSTIPAYQPEYADLSLEFEDRFLADPDYVAAAAKWSTCMSERGFEYADPDAPYRSLAAADRFETPEFRELEMGTAKADIECYAQHVLPVVTTVESAIIEEFVETGRLPELPGSTADETSVSG